MLLRQSILYGLMYLAALVLPATAGAEDFIAVITGPAPPRIGFDKSDLQDIFLKRIRVDDRHAALIPLNLTPGNPLRSAFSVSLLGERPESMQRYWSEQYFHGVTPPYSVSSQEAMLRFVADTPGAIGYVLSCRVDGRVRVAAKLSIPAEFTSRLHSLCETPETANAPL